MTTIVLRCCVVKEASVNVYDKIKVKISNSQGSVVEPLTIHCSNVHHRLRNTFSSSGSDAGDRRHYTGAPERQQAGLMRRAMR
jgi:hypothetical protein